MPTMPTLSLKCVHAEKVKIPNSSVQVTWDAKPGFLNVEFRVQSPEAIRTHDEFPEGNWGLWEFDVVELFIRAVGTHPYYEFQLSPLGQPFELEITEPRKIWNTHYRSRFKGSAQVLNDKEWTASFEIPLDSLGAYVETCTSLALEGNFFAILGSPGARTYWSAFLPEQEQPDFHTPQYFKKIL